MKKKLAIVVITYNSSKYLEKLLKSILQEKKLISEIVIVENDSPDKKDTLKVFSHFKSRFEKELTCKLILRKNNAGFANSCNLGAKQTTAKNILFLNPDVEIRKKSLSTLLDHMEGQNADIIGGLAENYHGKTHGSVVRAPNIKIGLLEFSNLGKLFKLNNAHKEFYYEDLKILKSKEDLKVDAVSGAYLLISRKAFNELKGFDEGFFMYLEDVDLGKRAGDLGLSVVFCPHSKILHVGGASSKNKYKIRHQAWFDSRKYYFQKHFGLLTNSVMQPLYNIEEWLLKRVKKIQ